MTQNVVKLPTAAPSYVTVRKARDGWTIELVTPVPGKSLRTALYLYPNREAALADGRNVAARMQRPFKAKGGQI